MKQQDTLEKLGPTMRYDSITGGQDFEHLSRTMYRGVEPDSSLKLTDPPPNQLTYPLKVTRPFANCSIDLITDLPPVGEYDSILVVVDQGLSKGVILIPCNKTLTSVDMAQLLLENLYKRFGLRTKLFRTGAHNLHQKPLLSSSNCWGSNLHCPQPITLRPMEQRNE